MITMVLATFLILGWPIWFGIAIAMVFAAVFYGWVVFMLGKWLLDGFFSKTFGGK